MFPKASRVVVFSGPRETNTSSQRPSLAHVGVERLDLGHMIEHQKIKGRGLIERVSADISIKKGEKDLRKRAKEGPCV